MIIEELHHIQHKHGYVPEKELYALAARINVPVYELHGVATFYPHFRMQPPPKADIRVCGDFPCRLRGAHELRSKIEQLTAGMDGVVVGHASCLGQCDRAPGVMINDHPFAGKSDAEILQLCSQAASGQPVKPQHFDGLKGPFKSDPYATEHERYGAARALAQSGDALAVIQKLNDAGLRGMGGAGFPTGKKWEAVKNAPGDEKYIVCNADECEVGTFKDREIMKNVPWLLVEGMVLAGLVTGATRGYIYIRHEYHDQINIINKEIEKAKSLGIVGDNVCGSGKKYQLEVFVSPGGYIQGEESALLEAIEGKRGQPRVKPPFPVFVGLWGKPTVINNVETLSYAPAILMKGPDWFKDQGRKECKKLEYESPTSLNWKIVPAEPCKGLKWMGVSGHVNKPGVFEVGMGTSYREAIYDLAGGVLNNAKLKAFAPSGPSGGFLPASMIDLSMDFGIMGNVKINKEKTFGAMLGSGAVVAVAEGACMLDLALNAVRFFRNESCGKCVPCRLGSQKMVDIIHSLTQGKAAGDARQTIDKLADTLLMTSICGLGQVVPAPILSVIHYFREELEAHAQNLCPSGVCFKKK
jgi:NADH:ubiquinone oxidoreductase subunit F (NADH-binding)/NADH:ubiquinone oxidoreductase subunit E